MGETRPAVFPGIEPAAPGKTGFPAFVRETIPTERAFFESSFPRPGTVSEPAPGTFSKTPPWTPILVKPTGTVPKAVFPVFETTAGITERPAAETLFAIPEPSLPEIPAAKTGFPSPETALPGIGISIPASEQTLLAARRPVFFIFPIARNKRIPTRTLPEIIPTSPVRGTAARLSSFIAPASSVPGFIRIVCHYF